MKLSSKEWQNRVLNLHELVPLARQSLEAGTWSYLRGGSDSEMTLRRNRHALDSLALQQTVLNDVSQIDPSATLFGKDVAMPIITAPVGNSLRPAARGDAHGAFTHGPWFCSASCQPLFETS